MKNLSYLKFLKKDKDFLQNEYPHLSYKVRYSLWEGMFIKEASNGGEYSDSLAIFNKENYEKWKIIESDIDKMLEAIIENIDACWSPWAEDCDWEDCSAEIYRRLKISKVAS